MSLTSSSTEDKVPSLLLNNSFRDPAGVLFSLKGRIIRIVNSSGFEDLTAFLNSGVARRLFETGQVVRSRVFEESEFAQLAAQNGLLSLIQEGKHQLVLEHDRIPFPSYPHEWPAEMLQAAGALTIDLAASLLEDGLCLKDATPFNILFRGPVPVFVDLLSFERRDSRDPIWLPYAQFVRTFLLPLLVHKKLRLATHEVFMSRRDGLEPDDVYPWLHPLQRLSPQSLALVSIPKWLGARKPGNENTIYSRRLLQDPQKAQFILKSLFGRLQKTLKRLGGKQSRSVWSDYMGSRPSYTPAQFAAKESFVTSVYQEFSPQQVLDIGCNTGHFSLLASQRGAHVVAIDSDPVVVGRLWRKARSQNLELLPLVVNLGWPTPAVGWNNQEFPSFLDRARGHFDFVQMLAVIHHLLISERVPLRQILRLASDLTSNLLLIEYVDGGDPMFRKLLRGRDHLHADWDQECFERECSRIFEIVRNVPVADSSRRLYLLKKKT